MDTNIKQEEPKYITKKEAAKILRCDEKTISRYAKSGYLRAEVIGRRLLFNPNKNSILRMA